jgi:hypothetical protein
MGSIRNNLGKKYDTFNEDVAKEAKDFLWKMTDTKLPNPSEVIKKKHEKNSSKK